MHVVWRKVRGAMWRPHRRCEAMPYGGMGCCRSLLGVTVSVGVLLLSSCGGSSRVITSVGHGKRVLVEPFSTSRYGLGAVQPEIVGKRKLSPAEAHKLLQTAIRFAKVHCPCTYEETPTGSKLLSERHP